MIDTAVLFSTFTITLDGAKLKCNELAFNYDKQIRTYNSLRS